MTPEEQAAADKKVADKKAADELAARIKKNPHIKIEYMHSFERDSEGKYILDKPLAPKNKMHIKVKAKFTGGAGKVEFTRGDVKEVVRTAATEAMAKQYGFREVK